MSKMIETDKSRDLRRGGGGSRFSRQIKQSAGGLKLISGLNGVAVGDFVTLEKSNNERIKKLSAVNRAISSSNEEKYEMGCDIADGEEIIQTPPQTLSISGNSTRKRFKLPRKHQIFDDCNGVDHVSVPRKLRSAMKKRNPESISPPLPDSKKLNYSTAGGVESLRRIGVKKSKLNQKQGAPNWSLKESAGGPITKDEEEVVETLFALAGMFSHDEPDCNNKLDSASLDASPSALPDGGETHPPKIEDSVAIKEDLNVTCASRTDEDVDPAPEIERSLEETTKVCSLNGPSIQESSDFPSTKKLLGELDSSVAQVNLPKMLVKNEEQKLACNSVSLSFPTGSHQDMGKLNQQAKLEISPLGGEPETAVGQTMAIGSQDKQHTPDESRNFGPALWPGLSSTVLSTACHGPLSQSCAAKMPSWLGMRPGSFPNGSSSEMVFKVSADRRLWKRCAAHVYISRLIRALQMPESKESLPIPPNQLKPQEILKQGVLMTINDFSGIRNNLNGITSSSTIHKACEKNSNDNKNGILQHLRPIQDNLQTAPPSSGYTSHKQSFNFLSLSAGGGGIEPTNSLNGAGTGLESLAQLQVPYHAQHPTFIPLSMSQTRYTSVYPDQPSAAAGVQQAQLQIPSHLSSPYCVPHPSPKAMTKQPQQQQQHQLWAAQLAAQYRNTGTSTAMAQFPSWQNGRQDAPVLMPCIPPSPSTIEILGMEYPQMSQQQQQQQFMAIAFPHARAKRQDHHISSVYEENGVGFRAGGSALPLQLLCNEQL